MTTNMKGILYWGFVLVLAWTGVLIVYRMVVHADTAQHALGILLVAAMVARTLRGFILGIGKQLGV
jgi:hypothetical protein